MPSIGTFYIGISIITKCYRLCLYAKTMFVWCIIGSLLSFLPLQAVMAARATIEYYHYNHQGSLLEVYDGATNKRLLSQAWSPWGERQVLHAAVSGDKNNIATLLAGGLPAHLSFTGHTALLATDLVFAGDTRLYDPRLKRFLNSDDRTTGSVRGQNRYSYAYNNPMTFIDPDGRAPRNVISEGYRQGIIWRSLGTIRQVLQSGLTAYRYALTDTIMDGDELPPVLNRRHTYMAQMLWSARQEMRYVAAAKIQAHLRGYSVRQQLPYQFYRRVKEVYNGVFDLAVERSGYPLGYDEYRALSDHNIQRYFRRITGEYKTSLRAPLYQLMRQHAKIAQKIRQVTFKMNNEIKAYGVLTRSNSVMRRNITELFYSIPLPRDLETIQETNTKRLNRWLCYYVIYASFACAAETMFPELWGQLKDNNPWYVWHMNAFAQDINVRVLPYE